MVLKRERSEMDVTYPKPLLGLPLRKQARKQVTFIDIILYNINSMSCMIRLCTRARLIYTIWSVLEPGAPGADQAFLPPRFYAPCC